MGGGGQPPSGQNVYPDYVQLLHEAIVGSASDLNYNLMEVINEAAQFNPWSQRRPYDPNRLLVLIDEDIDAFRDAVSDMDPVSDVSGFIESAATKYDDAVDTDAILDAHVAAHDAATEDEFQRALSQVHVGMWMDGAFMTSQFGLAGAMVADRRQKELANMRSQLAVSAQSVRSGAIVEIARAMQQELLTSVQLKQGVFSSGFDNVKLKTAAITDYEKQSVEFESSRKLWKFNLLHDATPVIMSITGAQMVPRTLTKGELATARIGTAFETGLQFGAATNPVAGILAGAASLGINAIGDMIDGNQ